MPALSPLASSVRPSTSRLRAGATVTALAVGMTAALPATALAKAGSHRVDPGDSLSLLAQEHGIGGASGWRRIFDANPKLDDPDLIQPGQVLRIPGKGERVRRRSLPRPAPAPERTAREREVRYVAPSHAHAPEPAKSAPAATRPSSSSSSSLSSTSSSSSSSSSSSVDGVWSRLAACESGGNWSTNTGNGYYGGLQFSLSTWRNLGGSGYPHEASAATQIAMGEKLRASSGWGAWPSCSAKLGLR